MNKRTEEQEKRNIVNRPPDPNKAVATPDTNRTTFGSMRRKEKSPKSTFNMESFI